MSPVAALSGRIGDTPSRLLHDGVLEPQFRYEARHLLPWYVLAEKVLLTEYRRMELITADECTAIAGPLHELRADALTADPAANLSDISLAVERYVEERLPEPVARWHVDRSRNDLQACAQLLAGRDEVIRTAGELLDLLRATLALAGRTTGMPMPGYTQQQAAQIITPGFYFSAVAGQTAHTITRLLTTYDDSVNRSPLGAGAMAGQELPWDRGRMARLMGCDAPVPHALAAVASRVWRLEVAAELSAYAVTLTRFATDLMMWAGELGFVEMPDAMSGISAAMPQKKNYPVLERIRGRAAYVAAGHLELVVGQRGVPYTNMIEVSKEAGGRNDELVENMLLAVRLFTAVLQNLQLRPDRMRAACEREFLGGFTLANLLTLRAGVPWRTAQVIAGGYITSVLREGLPPGQIRPDVLTEVAEGHGARVDEPALLLATAFDVDRGLRSKVTAGSAHPDAVTALLTDQRAEADRLAEAWAGRRAAVCAAVAETDRLLGLTG